MLKKKQLITNDTQWRVKITPNLLFAINYAKLNFGNRTILVAKDEIAKRVYIQSSEPENTIELYISYKRQDQTITKSYLIKRNISIDPHDTIKIITVTNNKGEPVCDLNITRTDRRSLASGISNSSNTVQMDTQGHSKQLIYNDKNECAYEDQYSLGSQYSHKDALVANGKSGVKRYKSISNNHLGSNSNSVGKNSKKQFFNKIGYLNKAVNSDSNRVNKLIGDRKTFDVGVTAPKMQKEVIFARYLSAMKELEHENEYRRELGNKQVNLDVWKCILRKDFDRKLDKLKRLESLCERTTKPVELKTNPHQFKTTALKSTKCKDDINMDNYAVRHEHISFADALANVKALNTRYADLVFEKNDLVNIKSRLLRRKEKQIKAKGSHI